jgi:hypothetical protein
MEADVIDDPDKSVNQQANGRCKKPLLKRGQEGMNVHVHVSTGTVAYCGQEYIYGVPTAVPKSEKHLTFNLSGSCNYSKARFAGFVFFFRGTVVAI